MDEQGRYWIDEKGTIYSVCRNKIRIKAQIDNGNGYKYVDLCGKHFYIHRLVAKYFVANDNPKVKTEVHHKDGNKNNNSIDNLEWLSPIEHRKKHNEMRQQNKIDKSIKSNTDI